MNTEIINVDNYFTTLLNFRLDCEKDSALTPSTQLLFRLLVEQANCHRWQDSFTYPIEHIVHTSHMSTHTIVDARRRLKTKGYIDFSGNPSRYTVYAALQCKLQRTAPPDPQFQYSKTNTKERNKQERKEEPRHDANSNHSNDNRRNLSDAAKAKVEQRLRELQQQCHN